MRVFCLPVKTKAGEEVVVVPSAKQVLKPLGLAPACLESRGCPWVLQESGQEAKQGGAGEAGCWVMGQLFTHASSLGANPQGCMGPGSWMEMGRWQCRGHQTPKSSDVGLF